MEPFMEPSGRELPLSGAKNGHIAGDDVASIPPPGRRRISLSTEELASPVMSTADASSVVQALHVSPLPYSTFLSPEIARFSGDLSERLEQRRR
jgi:hypothetical protein